MTFHLDLDSSKNTWVSTTVFCVFPEITLTFAWFYSAGNALVVIVVLCNPQMRSTTNLLIINLAIADLLFIGKSMKRQRQRIPSFRSFLFFTLSKLLDELLFVRYWQNVHCRWKRVSSASVTLFATQIRSLLSSELSILNIARRLMQLPRTNNFTALTWQ